MLNKDEFAIASKLYAKAFRIPKANRQERFEELLTYYNDLTGFGETEPNAIIHHSLEQTGQDCEKCGKPFRTPKASFCAACGNKKKTLSKE